MEEEKIIPEEKTRPEVESATCKICGRRFDGRFCGERARDHELIPVREAKFEVGDTIVTLPNRIIYINVSTIGKIEIDSKHNPRYDDGYHTEERGTLLKSSADGAITEDKLLHSPDHELLRDRILLLGIRSIINEIEQG